MNVNRQAFYLYEVPSIKLRFSLVGGYDTRQHIASLYQYLAINIIPAQSNRFPGPQEEEWKTRASQGGTEVKLSVELPRRTTSGLKF